MDHLYYQCEIILQTEFKYFLLHISKTNQDIWQCISLNPKRNRKEERKTNNINAMFKSRYLTLHELAQGL